VGGQKDGLFRKVLAAQIKLDEAGNPLRTLELVNRTLSEARK